MEQTLPERIDALHSELIAAIESGEVLAAQARFAALAEMAPTDIRLIALEDRLLALPAVIAALESAGDAETAGDLSAQLPQHAPQPAPTLTTARGGATL